MPLYRFDFSEGQATDQVTSVELRDDDAAIAQAHRTAQEIFQDGVLQNQLRLQWTVNVYRMIDNVLVKSISFGDHLDKE